MTNRVIHAVLIPRNKLNDVVAREEVRKYGIYFLFGGDEEKAKPLVYIGETEDCLDRIKTHNRGKDFWTHAVVISSKTNTFTKTHVKYLEYLGIKYTKEIGRYDTDNQAVPSKPYLTESMEADLLDNYETIKILLATLGFPIFEEIKKPSQQVKELLYCKGKDALAEGDLVDDGFVVFKNSKANLIEAPTAGEWVIGMRKKLIDNQILRPENGVYVFSENYVFNSPSAAAATVLARRANGWIERKNKNGVTIDKLYRSEELGV